MPNPLTPTQHTKEQNAKIHTYAPRGEVSVFRIVDHEAERLEYHDVFVGWQWLWRRTLVLHLRWVHATLAFVDVDVRAGQSIPVALVVDVPGVAKQFCCCCWFVGVGVVDKRRAQLGRDKI